MTSQPKKRLRRAVTLALGIALAGGLVFSTSPSVAPAHAVAEGLPTWADVERAKQNEATAEKKIDEIEALLVEVKAALEVAKNESRDAAQAYDEAMNALAEAQDRTDVLTQKAAESKEEADAASDRAAALVSQLYRSGGVDRNVELFLESDPTAADDLLERLAQVEKATERNTTIADRAAQAVNTAKTLAKQAESATAERDRLAGEAEQRKIEAQEAVTAASDKVDEYFEAQQQLEVQLEALKDKTTKTTKGYQERVRLEEEERRRIEEEARRAAEAAAAAAAAEAAAGGGGGGGGGGSGGGGSTGGGGGAQVSGSWRVPINSGAYYVSDWWGAGRAHTGVDLAAPGGTPIHAAASGTITMAGWWDPCYGYVTEVTHGNGVATRYAHQMQPPPVSLGQWVEMGQVVGYVGTTGCSTGNHLHFEVYTWGYPIDPAPFFAARNLYF